MSEADKVRVRALRYFEGAEGLKIPGSEPFEVSRARAAELMQNNLVEIVGEAAEKPPEPDAKDDAADAKRKRG